MFNLIKMDLYRMFKNKTTWFILIAVMLMMFASTFRTHSDYVYYMNNPTALENLKITYEDVNWGIYIGSVRPSWCTGAKIPLGELITINVQSKILLMFLVVFTVAFVGGENRTGFIKNIAGQVKNRGTLIISKLISVAVFSVMLLMSACIMITLGCLLFFGYVNFNGVSNFIPFFITQLFLHIAFGAVMILLITILQSSIASMLIGILVSSGILEIVDTIIGAFSHSKVSGKSSVLYYTTSGNIGALAINSASGDYIRAFSMAAIFMIVTVGISMHITKTRDVK